MLPKESLLDRVAIVTGGGTGLGFAMAQTFASLGADLVLTSRSQEHLDPAAEQIRKTGRRALAVVCDVRQPAEVQAMVQKAVEAFGRIDILVNNAAGNFICPAENLSPNGWTTVINIVLNGTFFCSRFAGEVMIRQKRGVILNVGATYAWTGGPGTIHSACAKAGVHTMTQTLAVEWARHNIRVNAIVPGPVHTEGASQQLFPSAEVERFIVDKIPLKRLGSAAEIADLAALLVSDYASFVTGSIVTADGGAWLNKGIYEFLK